MRRCLSGNIDEDDDDNDGQNQSHGVLMWAKTLSKRMPNSKLRCNVYIVV